MVNDAAALAQAVRHLLDHPQERQELGRRAQAALIPHQGAARRQAELIAGLAAEDHCLGTDLCLTGVGQNGPKDAPMARHLVGSKNQARVNPWFPLNRPATGVICSRFFGLS